VSLNPEHLPETIAAPGFFDQFDAIRRFDVAADEAFDRLRGNPIADRAFYAITELGDFGLIWMLIGGVRALRNDDDIEDFVRLAVTLGVESLVVNGLIKNLVKRERPVVVAERPHVLRIPLTTSFPSGHASSAMTAATLLGQGRRTAPIYYALGLLVASSRVYVRIHHASDVVGGLAVGLGLGQLAKRIWPGPRGR
jgi:membrane-associated phospholipid phosphatase